MLLQICKEFLGNNWELTNRFLSFIFKPTNGLAVRIYIKGNEEYIEKQIKNVISDLSNKGKFL